LLLESQLKFNTLICDIITKKGEHDAHLQQPIKIVIHDTSSGNDVNLNSVILDGVYQDMSKTIPKLDCSKTYNSVVVTHVDDNGDVHCQLGKIILMQYIQVEQFTETSV
jgi:hypothetical protein